MVVVRHKSVMRMHIICKKWPTVCMHILQGASRSSATVQFQRKPHITILVKRWVRDIVSTRKRTIVKSVEAVTTRQTDRQTDWPHYSNSHWPCEPGIKYCTRIRCSQNTCRNCTGTCVYLSNLVDDVSKCKEYTVTYSVLKDRCVVALIMNQYIYKLIVCIG